MSSPRTAPNSVNGRQSPHLTLLLADDASPSLLDPQGSRTPNFGTRPKADPAGQHTARRRYRRCAGSCLPDERHVLWQRVDEDKHARILVEASETVWDSLISGMSDKELLRPEHPRHRRPDLPGPVPAAQPDGAAAHLHGAGGRGQGAEVIRYGKHTVSAMMDFELITVRPDVTLATVQRYLRLRGRSPRTPTSCSSPIGATGCRELPLTAVLLHNPKPW